MQVQKEIRQFLLVAGEPGSIPKVHHFSRNGRKVAEIGVSSSMAAAAL
jgi:L-serine deaminase